jgi:hypothetical protein
MRAVIPCRPRQVPTRSPCFSCRKAGRYSMPLFTHHQKAINNMFQKRTFQNGNSIEVPACHLHLPNLHKLYAITSETNLISKNLVKLIKGKI